MNIKDNKRKRESQEKIEKTFLSLIQKREVKNISISEICKIAKINRTTFYANYIDIYDLIDKVRDHMLEEFKNIYANNTDGHTPENYLKMFKNIKENQIFYKTYFKLGFDVNYEIDYFDKDLAKKLYDNKYIDYHCEFFKAGITAIIKKWLASNCKEEPEEILEILKSEYSKKL